MFSKCKQYHVYNDVVSILQIFISHSAINLPGVSHWATKIAVVVAGLNDVYFLKLRSPVLHLSDSQTITHTHMLNHRSCSIYKSW